MVVVGFNFRRKRNLALGIALSGVGAGLFVLAPVVQLARDYYGPAGFFIILAALTANIITFGQMCFPSKLELQTQVRRKFDSTKSSSNKNIFASVKPYFHVLTNKGMVCLFLCMFFYCLGTYLVYLHLPTFIVTKGFSAVRASFLISLSGILSLFGRLLTGIVANLNRINDTVLYSGTMFIVGIATFIYPFTADYFAGHVIYTVLLGLFFGSCYVTITAVSLKFVEISYVAAAIGLQFCFGGIGAVIGPVCAGKSFSYSTILAFTCDSKIKDHEQ
jgi:cyanate permease